MKKTLLSFKRCFFFIFMTLFALPMAHAADNWPSQPIRIIVPFTTGGSVDIMIRAIGAELGTAFNQAVVIENRPGAGGAIGTQAVARAAPDGHTLAAGTIGTHVVNPLVVKNLAYDIDDFAPISLIQAVPLALAVNPDLGVNTFEEFVELAKSQDELISIAAPSNAHHITIAHLGAVTGAKFQIVPYKGPAQSITDAIGGHISAVLDTGMAVAPHAQSGALKMLAIGSTERLPFFPDLPTIAELGYPGYEAAGVNSLYAPAGTPPAIIEKLNSEIKRILVKPEFVELIASNAGQLINSTPQELADWQKRTTETWGELIANSDLTFN